MTQHAFRTRIGRVRFKNGAVMRLLPSEVERRTNVARAWFRYHTRVVGKAFDADLAGYVIVGWDTKGDFTVRQRCYTRNPNLNTLPQWLAEAIRRERADFDMSVRLNLPPSDR